MGSAWHDGLVEAFPIPEPSPRNASPGADTIEEAMTALTISASSAFPFFSLPAEIRNRIYSLVLFSPVLSSTTKTPKPPKCRRTPTSLFLTSSRIHAEASYIFYTSRTFRLFPLQEFIPLPTLNELPPCYRTLVTNAELILGPGWTRPPRSWKVTPRLAKILKPLSQVKCLSVFVEVDPSHPIFASFRVSHEFYTEFAGNLLKDVLAAMPQVGSVQVDGNPSVQMKGPLVTRLRTEIEAQGRQVRWGKERAWSAADRTGLQAEIRSCGPIDWAEQLS